MNTPTTSPPASAATQPCAPTTPARRARRLALDWLLPALLLGALYGALTQRTWSVDGCLLVAHSDHFMDHRSYGHFLLRPVAFVWTALAGALGVATPEGRYHALRWLFSGLGVAALTLLYNAVRRSGRPVALAGAVAALAATALGRNALRHFATLDEKGLGMFLFALAVFATARLLARERGRGGPLDAPGWAGAATLWTLAVFGHLQNAPYAIAFVAAPVLLMPRRGGRGRRAALTGGLAALMAALGLALFTALHWGIGGLGALPLFLDNLFGQNPAPAPSGLPALAKGALEGWIKAFFIVDRLSPRPMLALGVAGFALLAALAGWGAWRRRDALAGMLAGGAMFQMALMPAANAYPNYGDSYTMLVPAAMVLLAAAPWRLVAALAGVLALVNLPAQFALSRPPLEMKRHLERMVYAQRAMQGVPWVICGELVQSPPGEQEFCPIFYPMNPELKTTSASLAAPPREPFLLEVPLCIERDGSPHPVRLIEIERALERQGYRVRLLPLWDPPRVIRSDFRAYGASLFVEPLER